MAEKRSPRQRRQCSTNAGYVRHQRARERACDGCKRAHAAWMRAYRRGESRPRVPRQQTVRQRQLQQADEILAMSEEDFEAVYGNDPGA